MTERNLSVLSQRWRFNASRSFIILTLVGFVVSSRGDENKTRLPKPAPNRVSRSVPRLTSSFPVNTSVAATSKNPHPAHRQSTDLTPVVRKTPAAISKASLKEIYGKLPLSFEPNLGQTDAKVKFLSRGRGYGLFLTSSEAVLQLEKKSVVSGQPSVVSERSKTPAISAQRATDNGRRTTDSVLRMRLVGANASSKVTGLDELPGKSNYFIGSDPKAWLTNVPNFARVEYREVYPGVDLIYYGNQRQLEYDWIVRPGADPGAITLALETGSSEPQKVVHVDANGDVVIPTSGGEVVLKRPLVYQIEESRQSSAVTSQRTTDNVKLTTNNQQSKIQNRKFLEGRYVLKGKRGIGFEVAAYDHNKPLIIDPVLSYSTYLGGTSTDSGAGIAVDASGNAYVTGQTNSLVFPTTLGAFQTSADKSACSLEPCAADVFVTKLNAAGDTLVYSTYLGGKSNDVGNAIAVDSNGNAYLTGQTFSSDFPTTLGAFQTLADKGACSVGPCQGDAFATKLNANGDALLYSSYLGGPNADGGRGIAIDTTSPPNIYVTGETASKSFPITSNAFQNTCRSCSNGGTAFITKLKPASTGKSDLVYSSFLGGTSTDFADAIAVDSSGNAYITGSASSTNFPTKGGGGTTVFQKINNGAPDAFVAEFNPAATGAASRIYSTYLGGGGADQGNAIAVDSAGNAYITGFTASTNFPTSSNPLQASLGGAGAQNAFVTKLNPTGSALIFSTYFGGNHTDSGNGIAIDSNSNIYLTGSTTSGSFPVTLDALQRNPDNDTCFTFSGPCQGDAFLSKLNATGSALIFSTFLGGSLPDGGFGIALDPSSNAYLTGFTSSTDFPVLNPLAPPNNALQGTQDAFIAKVTGLLLPMVQLQPGNLTFGTVNVGQSSTPQTVTITNVGDATLNISNIYLNRNLEGFAPAPDYSEANSISTPCGSTLAPGVSCAVTVTFAPRQGGSSNAFLYIVDDASSSPQTVSLTGTGNVTGPLVSLSPSNLNFGNQLIGTTSTPLQIILTNSGVGPLTLSAIVASPEFAQTNDCPISSPPLAVGASCTISVTYSPTFAEPETGTILVEDNAPFTPQAVNLSGTGFAPDPLISLPLVPDSVAPGSADFTLAVHGTGFVPGATVNWNGVPLSTTVSSSTLLAALVPAANVATIDTALVTVVNPGSAFSTSNAAFFTVTPPTVAAQFSDAPNSPIHMGSSPYSIAVGDFNNDGKLDLAVANFFSNNLTILLGNGDGTFTTVPQSPPTGAGPINLTIGDFNNDGNLDLAVANKTANTLTILLGNGDGTFITPNCSDGPCANLGTGTTPVSVAVGDFKGDGKLDLAVANQGSNNMTILLGDGTGKFTSSLQTPPTGTNPSSVAVGDFNGDGKLDLAVTNLTSNNITILLGDGAGNFSQADISPPSTGNGPNYIVTGDFNGDGKPDLAVTNGSDNTVTILFGTGINGNFTASTQIPIPATGARPVSVALGDFNGDGNLDLAVANVNSANLTILLGDGKGNFITSPQPPSTGNGPMSVAAGDFNRDGRLDLAVANSTDNTVSILMQPPVAALSPPTLDFGNQPVGVASAPQTATLTNSGAGSLAISSIGISGANAANTSLVLYNFDSFPLGTLSPGPISLAANVTASNFTITGAQDNGVQTYLCYQGTQCIDSQFVGAGSTYNFGIVTNTPIIISSFNFFEGNNDCEISNVPVCSVGASFAVEYATDPSFTTPIQIGTFTPVTGGSTGQNQQYSFPLNQTLPAGNYYFRIRVVTGAAVNDSQNSSQYTFDNVQLLGTVLGEASDYTQTNNCPSLPSLLPGGSSCTINVTFTPTAINGRGGTLIVTDNSGNVPNSVQAVSLTGNGTGPIATISPTSLAFGNQADGTTSAPQTVTLTNNGNAPLNIASFSLSTNYSLTDDLSGPLQPGQSVHFNISFSPTSPGPHPGTLTINDDANPSPQTVSLSGTGLVPPNPVPVIVQPLVPDTALPGGPQFTLTVNGTGFVSSSTVDWNGVPLATTFVSNKQLTAIVPQQNTPGTASITVVSPNTSPQDGTSNVVFFPITNPTASVSFGNAPGSPLTAGTSPRSVAMGDFNGDGNLDIAVANVSSNNVTILLGKGDGTFTAAVSSPSTGVVPTSIVVGDFNGDGKVDLAIANDGSRTVTILLGNGDGTFTPTTSSPSTGSAPQSVAVGDFNGDGKLDLAVANYGDSNVTILLGNGDGSFTATASSPGTGTNPYSVAVGDFNGDGHSDLVVSNGGSNNLTILLGNGDGTFTPAPSSPATGNQPEFVTVGDFNGDGKSDLAVANSTSNNLTILLGNGDGSFVTASSPSTGAFPVSVAVGDFNGDGKLDLAVANFHNDNLTILLGNGDGTFTITASSPATGPFPSSVAVGDFNGDGRLDLSVSNYLGQTVSVLTQVPIGTLSSGSLAFGNQNLGTASTPQNVTLTNTGSANLNLGTVTVTGVNASDFSKTGDNCSGIILPPNASCSVSIVFSPGTPAGENATLVLTDNTNGTAGSQQTVSLTGTGVGTPAVTFAPPNVSFGNQLVGTTSAAQTVTVTSTGTTSLNIGSVTPSGDFAIAFDSDGCSNNSVPPGSTCTFGITFKPTALGARAGTVTITDNVPPGMQTIALSGTGVGNAVPQINQPLVPESAAPSGAGFTLTVSGTGFLSNSVVNWTAGAIATPLATTLNSGKLQATVPASLIATAGTASVTVVNPAPGGGASNAVFFTVTNPTPSLGFARTDISAGANPQSVVAADFNHDGIPDLVVVNTGDDSFQYFQGVGDGTFGAPKTFSMATTSGALPVNIAIGDFNGDGNLDLAITHPITANSFGNSVTIHLGDGAGNFTNSGVFFTGGTPRGLAAGDFNEDGILDLAVGSCDAQSVFIHTGNGDGSFTQTSQISVGGCSNGSQISVATADVNNDGHLDIIVANSATHTISILLGDGTGHFGAPAYFNVGSFPIALAAGDFNQDGKIDIAVGNADNTLSILIGNGDGTFQPQVPYPADSVAVTIALGDFNGDGRIDLAVGYRDSSAVSILLGNGDGTFQPKVDFAAGVGPTGVAAADFNNDGRLDLATANSGASTISILLQAPVASLSSTSLAFGNQNLSSASVPQTVTLTNTGGTVLSIASVTSSGDFSVLNNNCSSNLSPTANCTFDVSFKPTALGARTGTVTITDNSNGVSNATQTISLSGTGVAPAVSLSPSSLTFPTVTIGSTSGALMATLTNSGTSTLNISSLSITGANSVDFAQTNNCGATVAAGASCTISVTFTPASAGVRNATITISDDAAGSPQSISLSGTGAGESSVGLTPASLTFPGEMTGTTSGGKTVTLTNSGTAALNISSITITGSNSTDFAQSNTCVSPVAIGASCTISATFAPMATGVRNAIVTITDDAPGSPHSFAVTGTGTAPAVTLSAGTVTFAGQIVGSTSTPQSVTLTNSGSATLSFTSILASGDFAVSNNCNGSVASGAGCLLSVTFTPAATGIRTGLITITDNSSDSPQSISLSGTGTLPGITLSAASLTFINQFVGTTSGPQPVTITSSGTATLNITNIVASGDFALASNTCPAALAPAATCTLGITFTPTATRTRTGAITLTDNAGTGTQAISLFGTGFANPVPQISLPLVPASATTGGAAFTLTVNGAGFIASSTVNWNGSARSTQFVKASQLTASINTVDISGAGTASVTVVNPGPGGGTSNVAFLGVATATSSVAFAGKEYATGAGASSVAIGDFNGDGKPDLAVANEIDNTVSILLGNGDGTFGTHVDYPTGNGPLAVVIGDFNHDGKLDLGIVNSNCGLTPGCNAPGSISILLGNGNGTFQTHQDYATGAGAVYLAAGDFNGDGNLDVAVANAFDNTVSVLLGNSDGTFNTQTDFATGSSPRWVTTADLNGDGKLDLALANTGSGDVSVLLGNGDGTFQPHVEYATNPQAFSVIAGDFNGDGKLDLAVANNNFSGSASILLGNGNGTFQTKIDYPVGSNPKGITIGDFNGDGIIDIAAANSGSNTISILLGNGNGTFQTHADFATGTSPQSVAAADFNGDGRLDLAIPTHSISVLVQGASLTLSATSLTLPDTPVNMTCTPGTVTLTNTGGAPLAISSIAVTGPFTQTNTCPVGSGTLAPGASCAISMIFRPTVEGPQTGTLTITSNATSSPNVVALAGTGKPACSMTSNVKSVTVLHVIADNASFTITHALCHAAGQNPVQLSCSNQNPTTCAFSPSVIGSGGASTLTVSNLKQLTSSVLNFEVHGDASTEHDTVGLIVLLSDFAFSSAPDTSTISAGQTGTFALAVSPQNGLQGTLSLACSGAPAGATCTVSPAALNLDGVTTTNATVTVSTTARSLAGPGNTLSRPPDFTPIAILVLAIMALLAGLVTTVKSQPLSTMRLRLATLSAGLMLAMVLTWTACGGGGSMSTPPLSNATPAGTYNLTVTGTYSSAQAPNAQLSHTATLKLTVN